MLTAAAPLHTIAARRLRWFDSISYLIGGRRWSSNDVEHGVLRGNAPSPASLFALLGKPQWAGKTFKAGDPRVALAIQVQLATTITVVFALCTEGRQDGGG